MLDNTTFIGQAVEADFARTRSGLLPVHNVTASDSGHVLKDAALEFEEDITSRGLTKRSIDTYRDSIEDFDTSCNKLTVRTSHGARHPLIHRSDESEPEDAGVLSAKQHLSQSVERHQSVLQ
jgi:hypothetical protein